MAIFHKKRKRAVALICGLCLLPFVLADLLSIFTPKSVHSSPYVLPLRMFNDLAKKLDSFSRDTLASYGKKAEPHPDLVYLAIDNSSIALQSAWPEDIEASKPLQLMQQGWPWSREVYKYILTKLFDSGARVVIFDLLFPTKGRGDEELGATLEKYKDRVVVGSNFVREENKIGEKLETSNNLSIPIDTIIPQTTPLDPRIGYVNFWPDTDNVIRQAFYRVNFQLVEGSPIDLENPTDEIYLSVTANAAIKTGNENLIPPTLKPKMIRFSATGSYPKRSVHEIFVESIWNAKNFGKGEFFKDKIVILGPEGNWAHDIHSIPLGEMPGPEIHLNALAALLRQDFIDETSNSARFIILLLTTFLAYLVSILFRQPLLRVFAMFCVSALFIIGAFIAFNNYHTYLYVALPLVIFLAGVLSNILYDFIMERREKNRIRSKMEAYVSKNLVKQILDAPEDYMNSLGGVRKPVSIFFSDVRGFTTMTESADSQALVTQLNEYFNVMVDCVFRNGGTLDKFIGDAIMAVWGNVTSNGIQQDACDGVKTCLEMHDELLALNKKWEQEGHVPLRIGMGFNHGEVIVGNMGSPQKMEFTVIGDAVNLASRLEGVTKEYGIELVVGESVAELVREHFLLQTVDLIQVKGKTKPVEIFTVLAPLSKENPEPPTWLATYEEGVKDYRAMRFRDALDKYRSILENCANPELVKTFIRRCEEYLETPPPESWDGVYVMTKK